MLGLRIQFGRSFEEEWQYCERIGSLTPRLERWANKPHFCCDWDGLLIDESMPEMGHCSCRGGDFFL